MTQKSNLKVITEKIENNDRKKNIKNHLAKAYVALRVIECAVIVIEPCCEDLRHQHSTNTNTNTHTHAHNVKRSQCSNEHGDVITDNHTSY